MATKTTDDKNRKKDDEELKKAAAAKKADEESAEDEDEEEDEEDEDEEDEDEEDEEEADAAPAKPVDRKHRPRHEEYFEGDRTGSPDQEDPAWWVPHAVLGALVLIGVLGFFGIFNKPLGFLAAKPAGATNTATTSTHSTPPSPGAQQQPQQPMQAPQPPRETFGAKHLLVMYKGSRRAPPNIERTKEEAKARATEAAKKAKGGAKFEDLVKEYSDEPGAAQRGGDLGKFQKGSMVPEFQAGLEKIKVGEVSDIVETPFGYHVILRTQ